MATISGSRSVISRQVKISPEWPLSMASGNLSAAAASASNPCIVANMTPTDQISILQLSLTVPALSLSPDLSCIGWSANLKVNGSTAHVGEGDSMRSLMATIAIVSVLIAFPVEAHHFGSRHTRPFSAMSGYRTPRSMPVVSPPVGAHAQCADGSYSRAESYLTACLLRGGVARWL